MSDVNKNSSTRDVKIDAITIVNSLGIPKDVTSLFNVINIYEDIFMPVVSGSIQLIDGVDLFSAIGLHGNEYLYISFSRPGENTNDAKYKRTFRIYKATERKPAGKTQAQSYVLHFCSEELVFSNQITLSRKLHGMNASQYAVDICSFDLKTNLKKLNGNNFERSFGSTNFMLTRYKPLEALEYLASQSYNENESTFLFFENKDGFNFISLESLFKRPVLNKLNFNTAKFTQDQTTAASLNANDVNSFQFNVSFDVLENTKKSAYNGRLYTLDLITQKYKVNDYSLVNSSNKKIMMDGYFPLNNAKNRNNKAMYEEYDTQINYWLTNKGQTNNPYFISKRHRIVETGVERTLMQRRVQLNLLRSTELQCIVPGNPFYSAGYLVEFDMPAFIPNSENERAIDPHHSGKYLISGVRHTITPSDGLQTLLTLCKNSVRDPFNLVKSENQEYSKARNY
jgi:hypothetical protein